MGIWGEVAGAATGTGLGMVGSALGIGNKQQRKQQKALNEDAMAINYKYGEMAADRAYNRQKEMYERSYQDESPLAKRKQLEEAGLSVGLMYDAQGMGGAGSISSAPMAATGSAQGGHAPTGTERQAAMTQSMAMGLSVARMQAEIENIKSDTELKKADTGKTGAETTNVETSTKLIAEQITNTDLKNKILEWDNKQKSIQTEIMAATSLDQIKSIQTQLYKLEWESTAMMYQAKNAGLSYEINEELKENTIAQAIQMLDYTQSAIYKNLSEGDKAKMDTALAPLKLAVDQGNLEVLQNQLTEMKRNNDMKIEQGYWDIGISNGVELFGNIASLVGKIRGTVQTENTTKGKGYTTTHKTTKQR